MKKFTAFVLLIVLLSSSLTLVSCDTNDILHIHSLGKREAIPSVAPTCNEGGLTEGEKCATCGAILVAQEPIAPLGHDYLRHDETDENGDTLTVDVCQREGCKESKIVTDKDKLIEEWRKAAGITEVDVSIYLKPYVTFIGLSSFVFMKVYIYGNDICIDMGGGKNLYDVTYTSDADISFDNILVGNSEKIINDQKVSDVINQMKNSEGCYFLTPIAENRPSRNVVVYKINDYFYFLGLSDTGKSVIGINYTKNFKDGIE